MSSMTTVLWMWILVVVLLERAVFIGVLVEAQLNVEEREMNVGGSPYHEYPLRHDSISGVSSASGVPRCLQVRETGICRARIPRWHYDSASATCRRFTYGGCHGNENNFPTEQHCRAACPDEIPCTENPMKVCRVSESACFSATCPEFPEAACFVLPCTCQTIFLDESGRAVPCEGHDTTTASPTDTKTTESSTKPDVTTSSVPGDDGQGDVSETMRNLVIVLLLGVGLGLVMVTVGVLLTRCTSEASRADSTRRLHECPEEAEQHFMHVPIFNIL